MSHQNKFRLFITLALVSLLLTFTVKNPSAQEPTAGTGRRGGNIRDFLGLGAAPNPEAAKKGDPLYQQNCAGCHGKDGRGAQAPNLLRSELMLHDEKGEKLAPVLKEGRTGMPPFPALSADDVYNISQYIHLQVELTANRGTYGQTYGSLRSAVTGDAKKGEEYFKSNCASCHSVTGDLAKIGAKFPQTTAMKSRFLWPSTPGPATAKVTTAAGQTFTGKVKTNTDFDISLVDATGNYFSWPRNQVKVELEDKLNGHRSMLPKYSDADINNLAAYLVTLK